MEIDPQLIVVISEVEGGRQLLEPGDNIEQENDVNERDRSVSSASCLSIFIKATFIPSFFKMFQGIVSLG